MKAPLDFSGKELLRVGVILLSAFTIFVLSAGRLAELIDPGVWPVVTAIIQLFEVLIIAISLAGIYLQYRHHEFERRSTERKAAEAKKRNIRNQIFILREIFSTADTEKPIHFSSMLIPRKLGLKVHPSNERRRCT
jgi:uncharacterized membrane protein (DUF485 family)